MTTEIEVLVIGGGLFGSIVAKALRDQGRSVLVVDDGRPGSGSRPAACLMKPSWFSGLGKEVYEPSLKLLDRLYGVQDIKFRVPAGHVNVHWVKPADVLQAADVVARVNSLERTSDWCWRARINNGGDLIAKKVVVAAGIWTPLLVSSIKVDAQFGMAFLWPQGKIEEPFVRVWAPYRQLVAFNRGDGLWVGDGTAIKNWSNKYAEASLNRCSKEIGLEVEPQKLFGARPYVADAKPCLLKEVSSGLWVATGGAKNGTLAAGWCAHQLMEKL